MAKYKLIKSKQFVKSYKNLPDKDKLLINEVLDLLCDGTILPKKYCDHRLKGSMKDYRECHVRGDLLLLYKVQDEFLVITAVNVGSHSKIF